jgi:parallel beta-helix repeat protein
VKGNTAEGNAWGFVITSGSNNVFTGNTAKGNTVDGFLVYFATNSIIKGNTADSNGQWGYFDYTGGSGTAGTANLYQGDECSNNLVGGSSPTGLCTPQT